MLDSVVKLVTLFVVGIELVDENVIVLDEVEVDCVELVKVVISVGVKVLVGLVGAMEEPKLEEERVDVCDMAVGDDDSTVVEELIVIVSGVVGFGLSTSYCVGVPGVSDIGSV